MELGLVHPGGVFGCALGPGPFVEHVPFAGVELLVHLGGAGVEGQLQAVTVRVEEVDALEDRMVGRTNHSYAFGFQPLLGGDQRLDRINLHRQMLHPGRRVAVTIHRRLRWQFEERQDVTPTSVQKDMHVRIRCFG